MATVDWLNYFNNPKLLPPRSHLIEAHQFLGHFAKERIAVDCGCGTGRDTLFLLEQGYQVYAFDIDLSSLQVLSEHPLTAATPKLEIQHCSFADYHFPRAHLINASACLFLSARDDLPHLWHAIEQSLYSGGIFCGHFLGQEEQDQDNSLPVITLPRSELEQMFANYYIVSWKEKREYSAQLTGEKRSWLVHTVIAMKR